MHHRHCTISTQQVRLASCMLAHQGTYGFVSQLSREHDISRQWLYKLRDKGREGMEIVFCVEGQRAEKEKFRTGAD